MIKLLLERKYFKEQTLGVMQIFKDDELVGSLCTLELPNLNNAKQVSCIPADNYKVEKYSSAKYKDSFHVMNVPNRVGILIHSGNLVSHTKGCILVGMRHADINKDGLKDVADSKTAMRFLNAVCRNASEIELVIV